MSEPKVIRVVGARQHNLKNITVEIPRTGMTVITGMSGSGKSSLAFDTIYAEGQRKYVESLSIHARQFLEQMQKPDVDRIDGSSPTLAIEQRASATNPRSTVATTTEIYDHLRLLFARVGTPCCMKCGTVIASQSVGEIVDTVSGFEDGTRILILAPLVFEQEGSHAPLLQRMMKQGYVRARIDGEICMLEDSPELDAGSPHTIEVVVDRLVIREGIGQRLADSVELGLSLGEGRILVSELERDGESRDQLFSSSYACPNHPDIALPELAPRMFSFNSPHGACPTCHGLGTVLEFDRELIVPDGDKPLAAGAVAAWKHSGKRMNTAYTQMLHEFCMAFKVAPEIPFRNIPAKLKEILFEGTQPKDEKKYKASFEGIIPNLRRRWESTDSDSVKQRMHAFLSESPCEACGGARLRPESLHVFINNKNIADVCSMNIAEAKAFFDGLSFTGDSEAIAAPVLREVRERLTFLCDVGVEYLSLNRASATLSGGESQRIRLATQIGSGLVGVCYVLDEPTIGLHQRDTQRLVKTLRHLSEIGNTVIVVEHDEECIAAADHLIDIGPGAGSHGGRLVAQGTYDDVLKCEESVTAKYLSGRHGIPVPEERRPINKDRRVEVCGAKENNLKNIDVRFPLGCFVCVTGVSGSGKSTLVNGILLKALNRVINGTGPRPGQYDRLVGTSFVDRVIQIDQTPIGRTPRSNPATYVGAFDLIRQLYAKTREAKIRGYSASRFSFNVKGGRCEECQGQGTKRIEMHFLPDVFVQCGACKGTRYNRETLEIRYRGKTIADILEMRVEEAAKFFDSFAKIKQLLRALQDVGLGYITLGQSSTTLSGGEAQRVKLAAELGKTPTGHTAYILDEPTTGLHFADIHKLMNVLNRLVALGHTVLVIEHNLDVIKVADWVIDLGPEGGDAGGEIVVEGRPEEIANCQASYTGRFLRERLPR